MSLSLCVSGILLISILTLLAATFLRSSKAKYPPGIADPAELRRIHTVSTGLVILGETLERLGIGSQVALLRFVVGLRRQRAAEDPELAVKDSEFEGVPVRLYQPRAPAARHRRGVLFFHGGGFVFGSIESYDSFCRCVAKASGAVLVSVGYRLAPEHPFPAALHDCLAATTHFLRRAEQYGVNPSSIVLCGDSAGGNLTAGVTQVLVTRTDVPRPRAQVLIYPSLQMIDYDLPSFQQNREVPPLLLERTQFFKLTYLGVAKSLSEDLLRGAHVPPDLRRKFSKWLGAENVPDEFRVRGYDPQVISDFNPAIYQRFKHAFAPDCSPLLAEDPVIRLLPKTYILTCEFDVLRDDGILYKKRLEDNGVPVTWHHLKDGFHGIVSFFDHPAFQSGKRAMDNVVTFIKEA